ncbi:hypothetical protein AZE42_12788 [Rhizopogon vesiculosus]|uniref:Uncharacterized protein n=1 Tax=Rhizopogon vesiculosus TaxID=180088 RepID=A0A1J8Q541_9AGAM|nr:hypothetical protein AZE42_12788 [Rhizopogon vesiculosus]
MSPQRSRLDYLSSFQARYFTPSLVPTLSIPVTRQILHWNATPKNPDHLEDGSDTGDAVGKALALIEQLKFANHRRPEHSSKNRARRKTFPPLSLYNGQDALGIIVQVPRALHSSPSPATRFTNLVDESPEVPKLRNKKYQDFKIDRADWKRLQPVYNVLKELATVQQTFSSAKHPIAWRTIPMLECLANRWRSMASDPQYTPIADAIQQRLKNVEKYSKKTSESDDGYFICLVQVLDPNYKPAYVLEP